MRPIALVSGASRGIGAASALSLAVDGFDIWLNYLNNKQKAEETAQRVRNLGVNCQLLPFDVGNSQAVASALNPLLQDGLIPQVLINNAGINKDGVFAIMSADEWSQVLHTNLYGFFHITHLLLPFMLRRRSGRIINIVSTSGQTGVSGQVNYSAAKAGIIGATRSLAVEVARRGVLVNAVAPGFIATDMTSQLPQESILPHIPLQRFGSPEEVANVVSFLASSKASYIAGQVIAVNGGAYT